MAGMRIEVTSSVFITMVLLSRSVSTLAVAQKAPKTGSLLPFESTDTADRNISIFPLKDSGSGSYTLICVPFEVFMTFGQSVSFARLNPKASRQTDKNKHFMINCFIFI